MLQIIPLVGLIKFKLTAPFILLACKFFRLHYALLLRPMFLLFSFGCSCTLLSIRISFKTQKQCLTRDASFYILFCFHLLDQLLYCIVIQLYEIVVEFDTCLLSSRLLGVNKNVSGYCKEKQYHYNMFPCPFFSLVNFISNFLFQIFISVCCWDK